MPGPPKRFHCAFVKLTIDCRMPPESFGNQQSLERTFHGDAEESISTVRDLHSMLKNNRTGVMQVATVQGLQSRLNHGVRLSPFVVCMRQDLAFRRRVLIHVRLLPRLA